MPILELIQIKGSKLPIYRMEEEFLFLSTFSHHYKVLIAIIAKRYRRNMEHVLTIVLFALGSSLNVHSLLFIL